MSGALIGALLRAWAHQRDYAQRLVADLSDEDMGSQPLRGVAMNHPAWVLGHLSAYPPALRAMLLGEPFEDPKGHRYGRDSRPSDRIDDYPRKEALLRDFFAAHDALAATLESVDPAVLDRPTPLERWVPRWPRIADATVHLMIHHESAHLGQISAWRRAGGRPSV